MQPRVHGSAMRLFTGGSAAATALFVLSAMIAAVLASAARDDCLQQYGAVEWPPPPRVQPLLPRLNTLGNMYYSAEGCAFSFEQHEAAHAHYWPCYHQPRLHIHTCTRDCLRANSSALVFGQPLPVCHCPAVLPFPCFHCRLS